MANGEIFGWTYVGFTQDARTQTRSSSEASYLREALLQTTNLAVYKNTLAKRVLFNADNEAVGLIVESGGLSYQLNVTKEVVLSAGAVRYLRYSITLHIMIPLYLHIMFSFDLLSF